MSNASLTLILIACSMIGVRNIKKLHNQFFIKMDIVHQVLCAHTINKMVWLNASIVILLKSASLS